MIEREINSVEELIIALGKDLESYSGSTWYRGQADSEWPLLPGYMRLASSISERTLLAKFRQSAALLIDTAPKDSFDWLFLMQHFGVPTRLLDWSESPLVGLYFAVEGYALHPDLNAALWLLRPAELNKNAGIRSKEEADYIPSFEDDELKGYSVDSVYNNRVRDLFPVATIATRNNARIQAQLGVFTIHHSEKIPLEEVGDSSHIIKYNVPSGSRANIKNQLSLLGFNRFQLFPELASIGLHIKDRI